MKEITTVHIGRVPFRIEQEAYAQLQKYLQAIEHVIKAEHRVDVLSEIESRIVELLAERGISRDGTIVEGDVEALRTQLGEPADFSDEEDDPDNSEEIPGRGLGLKGRLLRRDQQKGLIGGVCYGFGKYFGVSPFWFVLAFAVLTFFNGIGLVFYAIAWIIIPPVKTDADRLAMEGKPATLKNLATMVEQRPAIAGIVARRTGNAIQRLVALAVRVVISALIAILLIFLLGSITFVVAALVGYDSWLLGFSIIKPWYAKIGLVSIWLVLASTIVCVSSILLSLLNKTPFITRRLKACAAVGLLSLVTLSALLVPIVDQARIAVKQYTTPSRTNIPSSIHRVEAQGSVNVEFYESQNAYYEHPKFGGRFKNYYDFSIENDVLIIKSTRPDFPTSYSSFRWGPSPNAIDVSTVRVYLPKLDSVLLDGSDSLRLSSTQQAEVKTRPGHVTRFNAEGHIDRLQASLVPGGELMISGQPIDNISLEYQDASNSRVRIDRASAISVVAPARSQLCQAMNIDGYFLEPSLKLANFRSLSLNSLDLSEAARLPIPPSSKLDSVDCLSFSNESIVL